MINTIRQWWDNQEGFEKVLLIITLLTITIISAFILSELNTIAIFFTAIVGIVRLETILWAGIYFAGGAFIFCLIYPGFKEIETTIMTYLITIIASVLLTKFLLKEITNPFDFIVILVLSVSALFVLNNLITKFLIKQKRKKEHEM